MEKAGRIIVGVKIWFEDSMGRPIMGYGGYRLLKTIAVTESLSEASKILNISYGKAMRIIRMMEEAYGSRVVLTTRGGYGGGGTTRLTREGMELLEDYGRIIVAAIKSIEMLGFKVKTTPS